MRRTKVQSAKCKVRSGIRVFLGFALVVPLITPISAQAAGPALRINGSSTVTPVAVDAAEALRREQGLTITVDAQGGSSGGISGIGDGSIDIGMSSKPVTAEDRKKHPGVNFVSTKVGEDAVAFIVSADVWNGGVRSLTRQQARDLYEGRIRNWKTLGGPDRRVVFFNKEPGRGTWEVFAIWAYGSAKNAPEVSHAEVGANEEARNKVGGTRGAISQLSSAWAEGSRRIKALGIKLDDGTVVMPTAVNIANGRYPMSRPLLFLTNGPPVGSQKTFIDYVLSSRGQALLGKHGYLALGEVAGSR